METRPKPGYGWQSGLYLFGATRNVRRDPGDVVRERLNDLLRRLRLDVDDGSRKRDVAFDEILNDYEGYDIIEVICREAEFWTFSAFLKRDDEDPFDDAEVMSVFFDATAKKYAESADWPETEMSRANSFFRQLTEHSLRGGV